MEYSMKKYLLFTVTVFVFCSINIFSQQFTKKWEFPQRLIYVGDVDGDGVGEFVYDDYHNMKTVFYDAINQNAKWTINNQLLTYLFEDDPEMRAILHPKIVREV